MSYRTPRNLATGHGAAGAGTHHWWLQRVTAVALIPLAAFAIFPLASAVGTDHDTVLETYRNPFNAIVMALFLGTLFHHLKLGLQVVIEDYVQAKGWRTGLLLASQFFCVAFGVAGVFAVLKIAFTG